MRPWLIAAALLLSAAYWTAANDYFYTSIDEVVTEVFYREESAEADSFASAKALTALQIENYPKLFLYILEAFTMAQVLFAKVLVVVLIFLGSLFVPWLFFKPTACLLWYWGKALILYSLYDAVAGVVLSGVRACLYQC